MTITELHKELNTVDHTAEKRMQVSQKVLQNQNLVKPLLDILFNIDDKISIKAAWVLDYACRENLSILIPHLNFFTERIHSVHFDGAVRPVAKICESLAETYYSDIQNSVRKELKQKHIESIVETCFNYIIKDGKTAPKAYSMNTLYLFGKDIPWIHPELKTILERGYSQESAGFKARARHVLKKLKAS